MDKNTTTKITTFDEWSVAITNVLGLSENLVLVAKFIKGKQHVVTLKSFYNAALEHEGWQATIMNIVDFFCARYLFHNGMSYTAHDVSNTKTLVLDYFADFIVNAIVAGYEFS